MILVWDARIHTKNQKVYESEARTAINAGWTVEVCNRLPELVVGYPPDDYWDNPEWDFPTMNYEWYIKEAEKLVKPLLQGSM